MTQRRAVEPSGQLSRATAERLSHYLRCAIHHPAGSPLSSSRLASEVGVSDAQVRRDLAALGHLGQRGVGYDPAALAAAIRHTLGTDRGWRAVLVGVGNLARALLRYRGFREQGFEIVGLFDIAAEKIDHDVEGLRVYPVRELIERVGLLKAELGVISVPSEAAQSVADALVRAGVKGLLSFAPTVVRVPANVQVVNVDLAIQFEQLAFLVKHG